MSKDILKITKDWENLLSSVSLEDFQDKRTSALFINGIAIMQSQLNAKLATSLLTKEDSNVRPRSIKTV